MGSTGLLEEVIPSDKQMGGPNFAQQKGEMAPQLVSETKSDGNKGGRCTRQRGRHGAQIETHGKDQTDNP